MTLPGPLAERICSSQAVDGSFPSTIISKQRASTDHNACITGLVVRALGYEHLPPALHRSRERALDFLETCERSALPGAFGFWPERSQPGRPGDADDTAIAAVELFQHGRRSLDWLKHVALRILIPFRVRPSEDARPQWIQVGAFLTWLRPSPANVVDTLVNANVAALFALAGLRHVPAYSSATRMVESAMEWSAGSLQKARLIAPYYAHPGEFYRTLEHAVGCGAIELWPSLKLIGRWFGRDKQPEENRPVCCAPYGKTIWTAPVLQLTRKITTSKLQYYGRQQKNKKRGSQEIAQENDKEECCPAGGEEEIREAGREIRKEGAKGPATRSPVGLTASAVCRNQSLPSGGRSQQSKGMRK